MFPNGLSVLTHIAILLLGLSKGLVEAVAKKIKWDLFNFKFNLYLGWKIFNPLTSEAGDTAARRVFSYFIILAVFAMIISMTSVSVKAAWEKSSNIELVREALTSGYAQAKEWIEFFLIKESASYGIVLEETEPGQRYVFMLPLSEDISSGNQTNQ